MPHLGDLEIPVSIYASVISIMLLFAFNGFLVWEKPGNQLVFFGAIFFAWLFAEWKYNLWVSIFTHTFMNLSWSIFAFDDTALGGTTANIFRALTIIIAIGFTIIYKKRNNQEFVINKQTLVWKKT